MFIDLDIDKIIDLYINKKYTVLDISKIFNVNPGTIKLRLNKANVKLRDYSENQKMVMNRPDIKKKISEASKNSNEKRCKTNIDKYGVEVPSNNIEIKEKWKKEHLDKYNVLWPNQRHDIIDKIKNTNIKKYNVDNVSKIDSIKEKIKNNRWKNKTNNELDEIKNKTKITWSKNFIEGHPLKNKKIQDKIIETNLKYRGVKYVVQDQEVIKKSKESRIKNSIDKIVFKLKNINLELVNKFDNVTNKINVKCLICGYIFETVLDYVFHNYGLCPKCNPKNSSKPEIEIREFLESLLGFDLIKSNLRNILPSKKEIDIFIPSLKVAIEFNGLFYHNSNMVGKDYHLNKTLECNTLGYKLIHIFEDEWLFKKDIVKSRLKYILGISNNKKIYARQCLIKEISSKEKDIFLEKYHLQNKDISKIRLGAFYNNELVSVMTFSYGNISKGSKKENGVWELNRFCSNYNYHIPGIASKLLTYFKRNYKWNKIYSYADRRWSDGKLYYKLGFKLEKIIEPNYWYIKDNKRIHRFNLRKKSSEPHEISEWILRYNEGYRMIWDCGNFKFITTNGGIIL